MSSYTIATTLHQPYPAAVDAVWTALGDHGFGVLIDIDLEAALKQKLDVDIEPQVILGACRAALAAEVIGAKPWIATVLTPQTTSSDPCTRRPP